MRHGQRKHPPTSTQRGGHHSADVLPLAQGIRRFEDGPGEAAQRTGKRKREAQATGGGTVVGQADFEGYCGGKLLSPERRRCAVEHARQEYEVSERRACRVDLTGKVCTRWNERESTWRKSGSCPSRGTSQSKS